MSYDLLIKNGLVVTEEGIQELNIYIKGEIIQKMISTASDKYNADDVKEIVDATSLYVIPGGIDAHTHMDLPFKDDASCDNFTTGTLAALYGGTTTIIDFANQTRGKSLQEAVDCWHSKAQNKSYCDYAFHISVTDMINPQTLKEFPKMIEQGITSFKTFMAYPQMQLNEKEMRTVLREVHQLGGLVTTHAENGVAIVNKIQEFQKENKTHPRYHPLSRDIEQEDIAVEQLILWANAEKTPVYIVHMTSAKAMEMVRQAREEGHLIYGETCPQYLTLNQTVYVKGDFSTAANFILSPPLRSEENVEALWPSVSSESKNSGLFVVATDHCSFSQMQRIKHGQNKFWCVPNGIGGVEHRLEILFSEGVMRRRLTIPHWVELNSTNPAKLFGLYPKKGTLKVGSDADIVLWNPHLVHTISVNNHHMNCDYSPYEGMEIKGRAEKVWLRGKIVIDALSKSKSKLKSNLVKQSKSIGHGQYLKRGHPILF